MLTHWMPPRGRPRRGLLDRPELGLEATPTMASPPQEGLVRLCKQAAAG
jgi:hypothetical protein